MYQRLSYSRRRKKRLPFIILGVVAWIIGICCVIVINVMAASDRSEVAATVEPGPMKALMDEEIIEEEVIEEVVIPVIALDAGHGGEDEGCSYEEILEKDINLQIAKKVESQLVSLGYQVVMIRQDDTYIPKEQRVELANQAQTDLYVSIHQNTFEDSGITGIETWYDGTDTSRDSKRLAQLVQQQTIGNSGSVERELKEEAEFFVTGNTNMPACLIETGFLSNKEERELLITEEYQDKLAKGIADGIHYYFEPKTMYLTFDDGPSAENTTAILDILKERDIKATFFVVAQNVEKNPEVARRIVEEGHTIGIHCSNHEYETIYQSVESYVADFEEAYQTVLDVTGVETRLFRFPGGSINAYNQEISAAIIEEMTNRGFVYFDWNASLEDSRKETTPEELLANAKESTLGRKKVVLLAHDIVYNTVLCLEQLIDQFPEYKMEVLSAELEPIQFHE